MVDSPTKSKLRRFSLGGPLPAPETIAVWMFDVLLSTTDRGEQRATCYVRCVSRGEAFICLFGVWPGSKILGTGLPLSTYEYAAALGHPLRSNQVIAIDEFGRTLPPNR